MEKIGIIVAMDEELTDVMKMLEKRKEKYVRNIVFYIGNIKDKECIVVQSGVGKVNAARTTQVLISEFDVDCVINLGVAGGINEKLAIGDVIIPKKVVQHDFDITAFGHSKGYISGIGSYIECDKGLRDIMRDKLKKSPEREYEIKFGVVATGDIFCTEISMKNKILGRFKADVVDMECAAIGQVCYLERKPYMAIRSISDIPNNKNVETYEENLKLAAKRCANVLKEFLA